MGNADNDRNGLFSALKRPSHPEYANVRLETITYPVQSARFRYKSDPGRGWLSYRNSDNCRVDSPKPNGRGKGRGQGRSKGKGRGRGQGSDNVVDEQQETGGMQVKVHGMGQNSKVEVTVRCTVVKDKGSSLPHMHTLAYKDGCYIKYVNFISAVVSSSNEIATFPTHVAIIRTKEGEAGEVLRQKYQDLNLEQNATPIGEKLDAHTVCLMFEAFAEERRIGEPVWCETISNSSKEITIHRIFYPSGPCVGGQDVHLWTDGISPRDVLEIIFLDKDGDWTGSRITNKHIEKHKGALYFRAPQYRNTAIETDVEVYFQLKRLSDDEVSQEMPYTYTASAPDCNGRKRYRDSSQAPTVQFVAQPSTSQLCYVPQTTHPMEHVQQATGTELPGSFSSYEPENDVPMQGNQQYSIEEGQPVYQQQSLNAGLELVPGPSGTQVNPALFFSSDAQQSHAENAAEVNLDQRMNPDTQPGGSVSWGEMQSPNQVQQDQNLLQVAPVNNTDLPILTFDDLDQWNVSYDVDDLFKGLESCTADCIVESDSQKTSRKVAALSVKKQLYSEDVTLEQAVCSNSFKVLTRLLRKPSLPIALDSEGNSLLHIAAETRDRLDCLKILLENSAFKPLVNKKNHNGETALHWAVEARNLESVRLLLEYGADPNIMEHRTGSTALHLAAKMRSKATFDLIVKEGGDLDARRYDGLTPRELFYSDYFVGEEADDEEEEEEDEEQEEEKEVVDGIQHLKLEDDIQETDSANE